MNTTTQTTASKHLDRDEAIARIKAALKARSGKACWSVKGGRGTAWGWIKVSVAPRYLVDRDGNPGGYMIPEGLRVELEKLLGRQVHDQGVSIPSGGDYREEYVARAEGREPEVTGTPYWD